MMREIFRSHRGSTVRQKLSMTFFALCFSALFGPVASADSGCNWGNYSRPNTQYLSPQSGENNQTQINNAIAAAPSGGSVYLKSGTYIISSPVFLKSNIILEGDKDAVIQLKDHANWKTVQYVGGNTGSIKEAIIDAKAAVSNVEIKCFKIDGNFNFRSKSGGGNYDIDFARCIGLGPNSWQKDHRSCENQYVDRCSGSSYYTMIEPPSGSANFSVHDMVLQDGANDFLDLNGTKDFRFYNNFANASGHEVINGNNVNGMQIYGNRMSVRINSGVRIVNCKNVVVSDNEIYGFTDTAYSDGYVKNGGFGVQIAQSGTSNVQIFRNVIYNIAGMGVGFTTGSISLQNGKYPVEIHNNVFFNNGLNYGSATGGVVLNIPAATLIYNNTFDGNYGSGIYDSGSNARIISNIITGTKRGVRSSSSGSGIGVQGGKEISYNVFYDNVGGDYTKGGTGNFRGNPLYYKPGSDYHLQSIAGRWDPAQKQWVSDTVNSPAIDAGIPSSVDPTYGDYKNEPQNNGSRLNAGAYGNTSQASLSGNLRQATMPPAPVEDTYSGFSGSGSSGSGTGSSGAPLPGGDPSGGMSGPAYNTGSDNPNYYDPGKALTEQNYYQQDNPASSPRELALAGIFPSLGESAPTATDVCTDIPDSAGFIPCGRYTNDPTTPWNECDECDFCSIPLALQLVLDFLIKISGIVAVLAIVLGQLLAMTSIGDTDKMVKIKAVLGKALLGFGYVMAAWLIVNALLAALGYSDPLGGEWYTVC